MNTTIRPCLLLIANWKSDVGYAWWLMESFWVSIANEYYSSHKIILAFPTLNYIPTAVANAPIECIEMDFTLTDLSAIATQCRFIGKNNVELLYFTDKPSYHIRYALFRLFGANKIIVHDHTPGRRDVARGTKKVIKSLVNRIPKISATAMLSTSEYVRQRHIKVNCIPASKCYAVSNGLPEVSAGGSSECNVREIFLIPKNRTIMVMAGRASHYKGISFILMCMQYVIHQRGVEQIHFLFLGDGPDLSEFKNLADDLSISNYVSFPGRQDRVSDILQGCDFAIHPSKGEVGYSLSILEYMRASLPVIVPDNPSVCGATLDNKTGIIFQENNIVDASKAILKLLENPDEVISMGIEARALQQKDYTLGKTHRELIQAFTNVLPCLHYR